jgi:hypothetical protein
MFAILYLLYLYEVDEMKKGGNCILINSSVDRFDI